MSRLAAIGVRGAVASAGAAAIVSGIVFAFQGESVVPNDATPEVSSRVFESAPTTAEPTASASNTPTLTEQPQLESPEPATPAAVFTSAPRPMTQAVAPAPTAPVPVTDVPKYSDVSVLTLAADALLPSGRTFRECVELPPSHEKWPAPVHLYYEGKGKWLVETHVSEVQVLFDEATATFSSRNFAPPNPECLKPRSTSERVVGRIVPGED